MKLRKLSELVLVCILSLGIVCMPGCALLSQNTGGQVLTTSDNVDPTFAQAHPDQVVVVPAASLPPAAQKALGGKDLVEIPKTALKPNAQNFVEVNPKDWSSGTLGSLITTIATGAMNFFPQYAPWLGLIGLLFQRPRDHLLDAAGSLAQLDVKSAAVSIAKAAGLVHSDSDTAAVWNETAVATPVTPSKTA